MITKLLLSNRALFRARASVCFQARRAAAETKSPRPRLQLLSTTAAPTSSAASGSKAEAGSNVFLDNIGTVFLSSIGLLIGYLVRSYLNTNNRNAVRDEIESSAALDPMELDDLRTANPFLTPKAFGHLMAQVGNSSHEEMTYKEFVDQVRVEMARYKDNNFSVDLGHLLDRVVVAALQKHGRSTEHPMPMKFWWSVLSLALHSTTPERIQTLYQILQHQQENVTIQDVIQMVGYLQDTCQLVPDSQILPIAHRQYPLQQYEVASPLQLVQWDEGQEDTEIDIDAFANILRSKSVCAWGLCYYKSKHIGL